METWEAILTDVESAMAAHARADLAAEAEELRRAEDATVTLARRLRAMRGQEVSLRTAGREPVAVVVRECAEQWLLGRLAHAGQAEVLIPMEAIVAVAGMQAVRAGRFAGIVARKLSFAAALRALADRHAAAALHTADFSCAGAIARVGQDYVDVLGPTGPVSVRLSSISRVEARGLAR